MNIIKKIIPAAVIFFILLCMGTDAVFAADAQAAQAPVQSITWDSGYSIINVGKSKTYSIKVLPENYSGKITYTSSDKTVATVNASGKITAHSVGTATIVARSESGVNKSKKIYAVPEVTSDTVRKSYTIGKGETLSVGSVPGNADYTVTMSQKNIASYKRSASKVTGTAPGQTKIFVYTADKLAAVLNITVKQAPKKLSLSKTSATVGIREQTLTLKAIFEDNCGGSVTYTTSNILVAAVTQKGMITGKREGTATITATTYNGKKATCKVTVKKAPSSLKLNYSSATIGVGENTLDLDSSVNPGAGCYQKAYSSSNTAVAVVDKSGVVTGRGTGSAVITCQTYNGKKATCKITVKKAPTSMTYSNTNFKVQKGITTYQYKVSPNSGAASHQITYTSSDTSVATVSSSGYITPKKAGKTQIVAKAYNGKKITKTITVVDDNSLSLNLASTQISYDNDNVQKIVYGKSVQGRNLEAFIVSGDKAFTKTLYLTFAIHGFEDNYAKDGQVLTKEANKLIAYYAKHPEILDNYRLIIIPCLNPDGTLAGTNNQRACSTAFGRCTAAHVDMNRDFISGKFKATESRALRDFMDKHKPTVFIDWHGWLNETLGTGYLVSTMNSTLGLSTNKTGAYGTSQGYLFGYVHNKYSIPTALVEFKSPGKVKHSDIINAINKVMKHY